MASKVIETFIKKALFKKGGAMASNQSVKFSADALEKRIKNFGFNPDTINSEAELNQILAYLKQAEDQAFNQLYSNVLSGDDAANFLKKAFKLDTDNVVDMTGKKIDTSQGIMGGKSVKELLESGEITKGTVTKKSDKVKERKMFKEANDRFNKTDVVADIIAKITSMEPVAALKEANKVIRREGIYKNLDETQSKKILMDSEDWIFQRNTDDLYDYNKNRPFRDDPDFDPDDPDYQEFVKNRNKDDYATGGRAGFSDGLGVKPKINLEKLKEAYERMLKYNDQPTTIDRSILIDLMEAIDEQGAAPNYNVADDVPKEMEAAQGGIAKFYTGGMVDVEPNLSDIGHGSDALMARTRLVSPNSQATTSTGLNYLLAEDNDNIRIPFKTGTDLKRRAFLKLLAALGGGIATLKSGLLGFTGKKGATKKLMSEITTDNVKGKPEWFDALVTKVIREGDDVTKNFKTKERQIIHKKKISEDDTVTVTQDLDEGSITVDYDSPKNTFEDTVTLRYKKSLPDEGDPNPSAEFTTAESGPVGRRYGPDDFEIEVDEVGGNSIVDLDSDVSVLKEYATNKKPTINDVIKNMKRKEKAKQITNDPEAQSDAVIRRQGEYEPDPDAYDTERASGGRIGFSSGKIATQTLGITGSSRRFLEKVFGKEGFENIIRTDPDMYKGMLEVVEMFRNRNKEGLKMYLQKYLPHMDDEMIEDFIVGSGGSEGIKGQLIRLGSGRDYAGKLEMMKKADQMRKLDNLDVTEEMIRKPNASGGLAKLLGE